MGGCLAGQGIPERLSYSTGVVGTLVAQWNVAAAMPWNAHTCRTQTPRPHAIMACVRMLVLRCCCYLRVIVLARHASHELLYAALMVDVGVMGADAHD
jgi:hypothetical protein